MRSAEWFVGKLQSRAASLAPGPPVAGMMSWNFVPLKVPGSLVVSCSSYTAYLSESAIPGLLRNREHSRLYHRLSSGVNSRRATAPNFSNQVLYTVMRTGASPLALG